MKHLVLSTVLMLLVALRSPEVTAELDAMITAIEADIAAEEAASGSTSTGQTGNVGPSSPVGTPTPPATGSPAWLQTEPTASGSA
jgi:hypothetical protein